ncbi:hypothetical protein BKZ56_005072 [Escherichia coli]|nr:hypothetical protein [Escherichia coli]
MVALDSGKQTTVGSGGFFVCRQQITRRKKGSQEDPVIFLPDFDSSNCGAETTRPENRKLPSLRFLSLMVTSKPSKSMNTRGKRNALTVR